MHKNLFVFDIETTPDLKAAANLLGAKEDLIALRQALVDYHLEVTGGKNSFFRQPFHRVVTISFLEAEIGWDGNQEFYHLRKIRSGGTLASDEKEIVKGFFHYLSDIYPRLVSFNGRAFDLPVLKYRAMLHGIQARWLYQSGDKWNNYRSKYSLDWHCDLIDAFSDFGSSARIKMKEICAMLNFPGKLETEGSMVEVMYNEGKLQEIRDYCELDVINTYLLYIRHAYHIAKVSKESYNKMIDDLISFLQNEKKQHFTIFLNEWHKIGIQYL
ncbi:MAG: 3'-5' exonuclease [Candidatus Midichloria sp.]|nr:MAG: 3'-5' exonuclease [Candidatus Midichloria sp.]